MNALHFYNMTCWVAQALQKSLVLKSYETRGVSVTLLSPGILDTIGFDLVGRGGLKLYFQKSEWDWFKGFDRYQVAPGLGLFLFPRAPLRCIDRDVSVAIYLPLSKSGITSKEWGCISTSCSVDLSLARESENEAQEQGKAYRSALFGPSEIACDLTAADAPLLFVDHVEIEK